MENREQRTSRWLSDLRRQFVRIAARRVGESDAEDVAQEALRIIAEKGIDGGARPVDETAPLAWSFQVLRNTIGNHYQRQRTRLRRLDTQADAIEHLQDPRMAEALDPTETLLVIERALDDMARTDPACAKYLMRLADGDRAGDIADSESIERAAFYRRLYRCRRKLGAILAAKGVSI